VRVTDTPNAADPSHCAFREYYAIAVAEKKVAVPAPPRVLFGFVREPR
jgi:hypothetical protein